MNAITVHNLSKRYRIGTLQNGQKTFREAIVDAVKSPFINLAHLRSLTRFNGQDENDVIWALKDINFEVQQGEVIGIIGPNGAGKSTLLKILSRITEPTEGRAEIHGRVSSLLEVGTGFHPELTGRENVYLNAAILGMRKNEIDRKFDEIVDFSGVEKFIDTPVKRYSSGMQVRLAFAVAAHIDPEILVVDEVLAVGDAAFQKKCLGKMGDVAKQGRTVLFVSHNMGAINRLCSRCLLLDSGLIIANDITNKVISLYLSKNIKGNENVYHQDHDQEKDMNLRGVILNPGSGVQTNKLRYDRPITVRIEYEINRDINNCTVWMAVENSEGVIAFTTADYDQEPELLLNRSPGNYRSDVQIPANWLNTGQYHIVVGLVKNEPVEVYDRTEVLSFEINEVGSPASVFKSGTRRGILQPLMKWKHAKLS